MTTATAIKRGARFTHHRFLDADNSPAVVEVTRTKRYTRSTGDDSTLVYYRAIYHWRTGERAGQEYRSASYMCDIADAEKWSPWTP